MENEQRTDHDLLICIEQKIKFLQNQFENHLKHHFIITVLALSAALTGVGSVVTGILLFLIKT